MDDSKPGRAEFAGRGQWSVGANQGDVASPGRRRLALVMAAFGLVPGLAACTRSERQPLTVGVKPAIGNAPLFLARSQGWLDARQVSLVESAHGRETIRMLREGKVDAAVLKLAEALQARALGVPLSVAMVLNVSMGADVLLVRPGISSLAALKGQRIGYDPCSVNEFLLAEILHEGRLTRGMVRLAHKSTDEQVHCWQAREVDAMLCSQPVAGHLLALGAVRLFDSRKMPEALLEVLVVHNQRLDRGRGDKVRQLVAGHLRAVQHLQRNPQDATYRMAGQLNLGVPEVMQAFRGLFLADAAQNQRFLGSKAPALLASAQSLSSRMFEHGLLPEPDGLAAIIRAEFLPRSLEDA